MEPRIRYATSSDEVSIAFWTLGEGKPLVCLAGGPWCHVESWYVPECRRWYERLAQERMLVWHDLRGTGFSEREVSDYSLDALAADVEAVEDRLGLDDFGVLASVDAGPVGVAYAARHPERVSRLVLWCSWARTSDLISPRMEAWFGLMDRDWELTTDTCVHIALGWSVGEAGRGAAKHLRESVAPEAMRAALAALGAFDVTELLPRLKAPTLVLHRRDIPWLPVGVAGSLAARIPEARLVVLEGEATAPYLGDSEAAVSAVEEFLNETEAGRAVLGEASAFKAEHKRAHLARSYPDGLTAREVEVLRRLSAGKTNGDIAGELYVSVRTVERHIANIYAKIGRRGRANATAYALTRDLV
jgi:pimeloyl-ACP methyl ester carboxylesterase/DNA-binding CsgD family transcriptional regulator